MSNWQSIETAPKDGRSVDLWVRDGGRVPDCKWMVPHLPRRGEKLPEQWCIYDRYYGEWLEMGFEPSHWMPLPDAPPK